MPSNQYFRFKQFTIYQDQCSMKVCTDACVFGAHVAACIERGAMVINDILDIGTGTGLLSLLLAQKNEANIDAIEIDNTAAMQAQQNFKNSPWRDRLEVFNTDVLQYQTGKKYGCIIANPPFFEDDLHSPDERKNKAKHDLTLSLHQLIKVIDEHLSMDGFFTILLPYHRADKFITVAGKNQLYLVKKLALQHTQKHPMFRAVLYFTRTNPIDIVEENLAIKDSDGNYTMAFKTVLKDYYLHL
jgi:tRNA1Val (adenine37-N6)-methyltransferase